MVSMNINKHRLVRTASVIATVQFMHGCLIMISLYTGIYYFIPPFVDVARVADAVFVIQLFGPILILTSIIEFLVVGIMFFNGRKRISSHLN
jgi:hypothetical protein